MKAINNPNQNQLLAALPTDEFSRLSMHLELVPMPVGESFYEPNGKLQHVYFPTTSSISLRYVMENGNTAEIAGVGNEGMLGVSAFMGNKALPKQATVRTAGFGYRLKERWLLEEFNRAETLQNLLIRYTKTLITQASQTAVCNRTHSIEQRICRWLLLNFDHISSNDSIVTQELLANSLGVHRNILTETLRKLREAGYISNYGGHIVALNRKFLEEQSCECYKTIRSGIGSLLGHIEPSSAPAQAISNVISLPKSNNASGLRTLYNVN